jgi:hypothetical protein
VKRPTSTGKIDAVIQMVELITQIDESTYRELERRAKRRQRTVSDEAAEMRCLATPRAGTPAKNLPL